MRGHLQGYNAQAVTTEDQIVIAAELMTASPDFGHLEPMIDTAERELRAAGADERAGTILADAGYWHLEQMQNIVARGTQVLIAPDSSRRKAPRPGWDGGAYAFMRSVLATEHGGSLYRQRQHMVEPVFADTKFNRRLDRFLRRGRAAARTEWRLITATHNLLKLWRHTTAPQFA
jgi:Transposase DDE domain